MKKTVVGSLAKPRPFLSITRPMPRRKEGPEAALRRPGTRLSENIETKPAAADMLGKMRACSQTHQVLCPTGCAWLQQNARHGASVPTGSVPGQPSHSQAILLLPRGRRSSLCPGRGQMLISVLLTLKILFISVEWFVPGRAAVLGLRSAWEVLGHREMLMFSARCLSPRLWIPKVLFRDSVLADARMSAPKVGRAGLPLCLPRARPG